MSILRKLLVYFFIVLIGVMVDCGFLYYQATTGRRLPFKFNLFPRIGGDLS